MTPKNAFGGMVVAVVLAVYAPQAGAQRPKATPMDISGVWEPTGDFTSPNHAFPSGGDGVGWAPLSSGAPEARLANRPSKEQRDAASQKAMAQIEAAAKQDDETRIGNPAAAALPAATPDGQKAYEELNKTYNVKRHNERCYAGNVVSGVTSSAMSISQRPDQIVIAYETGFARIIYLDGRNDSDAFPGMFGFSVGRWEGSTLVVKTTKITGKFIGAGLRAGWPMSDDIALTEYFTPSADRKTMLVKRVFEDPAYYKEPLASAARVARASEGLLMSPCVEGLADSPFADQAESLDQIIDSRK